MLFIENVGNLVCPAVYDLGEATRVVALSLTEGEDKPLKYPIIFRKAIWWCSPRPISSRTSTCGWRRSASVAKVMPEPRVILVSARTGEGIPAWLAWLDERRATLRRGAA